MIWWFNFTCVFELNLFCVCGKVFCFWDNFETDGGIEGLFPSRFSEGFPLLSSHISSLSPYCDTTFFQVVWCIAALLVSLILGLMCWIRVDRKEPGLCTAVWGIIGATCSLADWIVTVIQSPFSFDVMRLILKLSSTPCTKAHYSKKRKYRLALLWLTRSYVGLEGVCVICQCWESWFPSAGGLFDLSAS